MQGLRQDPLPLTTVRHDARSPARAPTVRHDAWSPARSHASNYCALWCKVFGKIPWKSTTVRYDARSSARFPENQLLCVMMQGLRQVSQPSTTVRYDTRSQARFPAINYCALWCCGECHMAYILTFYIFLPLLNNNTIFIFSSDFIKHTLASFF